MYIYNKWASNSVINTCVFQTGCVFIHTTLKENHNGPFARWHHLLLWPASFRVFLSCANYGFCHLNLARITKFKYEKENEKDSGHRSKMTRSYKWSIYMSSPTMWWTVTGGAAGGGYSQVIPMEEVSSKINSMTVLLLKHFWYAFINWFVCLFSSIFIWLVISML